MTQLTLATTDGEFDGRVRRVLGERLDNGAVASWAQAVDEAGAPAVADAIALGNPAVVAIGPGLDSGAALVLARSFDRHHPDISVLLVAPPASVPIEEAMRAGIREIVAPDASDNELRVVLERALDTASLRRASLQGEPTRAPTGRVILVLSPKGGAGKTTMSTNLAVGLAKTAPREVVLVDCDLQFGDVAAALRLMPEYTLADIPRLGHDLDATDLKVFLTPHPAGLFVLCAPESPAEADAITGDHIARVIQLLGEEFRYVVIDTNSGVDEPVLAAIEHATDLVLVCSTDVPTVRAMRKEVETLRLIGATEQRRHFVLNRSGARVGLSKSDIESTVGVAVDIEVPSSRTMPVSMNQGTAVLESSERSPAVTALASLVGRFADVPLSISPPPVGRGGWRFWRNEA